jgi:peptidoglycan hydrolase-like protein with peptidoglycan-binding domain
MLHLMESGFFGKQLLNEGNLSLSENLKVRIFQSFYNYYNQSKWILVDGIPGTNTANAMKETFKKDKVSKDDFEKDHLDSLNRVKNDDYLSDLKTLNDIHNLRVLQSILCLAGAITVIPDGVLGPKTKAAIKEKLGVDNITKVDDNVLKKLIDDASANVKATDMSFKAEGVEVVGGAGGTTSGATDANTSTTDANTGTNAGTTADANADEAKRKELDKIFFSDLNGIIGIVKDYVNKYGMFDAPKDSQVINFYYPNILNSESTYFGEAKNPTKTFENIAKSKGFETEGCWRYIDTTKKIYFFKCGEYKRSGFTTKTQNFYKVNETPESLSEIAYTYG